MGRGMSGGMFHSGQKGLSLFGYWLRKERERWQSKAIVKENKGTAMVASFTDKLKGCEIYTKEDSLRLIRTGIPASLPVAFRLDNMYDWCQTA